MFSNIKSKNIKPINKHPEVFLNLKKGEGFNQNLSEAMQKNLVSNSKRMSYKRWWILLFMWSNQR